MTLVFENLMCTTFVFWVIPNSEQQAGNIIDFRSLYSNTHNCYSSCLEQDAVMVYVLNKKYD